MNQIVQVRLLTTDYLPNIGGVAQHIYELAKALAVSGHNVEVVAPQPKILWSAFGERSTQEFGDGFGTYRIPWVSNRRIRYLSGRISGILSKRRFFSETCKRLNRMPSGILHWHALDLPYFPAEHFDGPRVWTNHTSNFIQGINSAKSRLHYSREAGAAHRIICPSEELAALTAGLGVEADKVHFISNGVDGNRFRPNVEPLTWRTRLDLRPGTFLVLCPRRLEKKNGVRYFVEAALRLLRDGVTNCAFAIAGDYKGPRSHSDEAVVRDLIDTSSYRSCFHLLGRVENTDIAGLYAAADLVVMPSLMEATSLSAMEAMATGKAVVATDVGGLPFLIRDSVNGLLVPSRDSAALAAAMKRLHDNSSMRSDLGRAGRQRVEKDLDWSAIARQTLEVYQRAEEDFVREKRA